MQGASNEGHQSDLQFQAHLEEYKALRGALSRYEDALANNTNFTLAALATVIALGALLKNISELAVWFLIVPAIFYTLCWAHLRIVMYQNIIISYFQKELFPRIRSTASDSNDAIHLLQWETYQKEYLQRRVKVWNLPILGPLFSLQVGSSIVLVAIPVFMSIQGVHQFQVLEYVLLTLNGIVIVYTAIQGWLIFQENIH